MFFEEFQYNKVKENIKQETIKKHRKKNIEKIQ